MHVDFKDGDKKKIYLKNTGSWAYQSKDLAVQVVTGVPEVSCLLALLRPSDVSMLPYRMLRYATVYICVCAQPLQTCFPSMQSWLFV